MSKSISSDTFRLFLRCSLAFWGVLWVSLSPWVSLRPLKAAPTLFTSGDLKLFHTTSAPPRGIEGMSGSTSGAMTSRLKLSGALDDEQRLGYEAHALLTSSAGASGLAGAISLNPNATGAPEGLPLSLDLSGEETRLLSLKADRLLLSWEAERVRLTLGRQAVTLGQGRAFTPLDRLTPLSPTTIDREYKPGLDALKLDAFWGVAGQLSLIAAYASEWSLGGSAFALTARDSLWSWDLALTAMWVRGDVVAGLSFAGAIGPLNTFGDASWTWPKELLKGEGELSLDEGFSRLSGGVDYAWPEGGGGFVSLELSWQGDGARPGAYLLEASDPRVLRGERWLLGRAYATLSVSQAITPLLNSSLAVINNLEDPSAMVGPSLSWSVSQEVSASLSGFVGMGESPSLSITPSGANIKLPSEFGALSWVGVAMISAVW